MLSFSEPLVTRSIMSNMRSSSSVKFSAVPTLIIRSKMSISVSLFLKEMKANHVM